MNIETIGAHFRFHPTQLDNLYTFGLISALDIKDTQACKYFRDIIDFIHYISILYYNCVLNKKSQCNVKIDQSLLDRINYMLTKLDRDHLILLINHGLKNKSKRSFEDAAMLFYKIADDWGVKNQVPNNYW